MNYKRKMETEISTSLSGEARSRVQCWPRLFCWKPVYLWAESLLALVTDCPFQLSSFVLCLPHMTLTTCACWYLPSNIYSGQFPPPWTIGTVLLFSLFNSVSFLFVYLVLKSLLPESRLNCPYLAPEALLFYRSSTLYYLHLFLCPVVYLCPWWDFLWPSEWASWLKAKLLPSPSEVDENLSSVKTSQSGIFYTLPWPPIFMSSGVL